METSVLSPNISATKQLKVYTGLASRILNLLCSGCTAAEAAMAVGVTADYVHQLKMEEDFVAQIKVKLQENQERALKIDENYAEMEATATKRLRELMPMIHSPKDLMAIAAFANSAKKKTGNSPTGSEDAAAGVKVVRIMMPTVILNNFSINPNNEIVAAGGRELTTLNSASITSLANANEQALLEYAASKPVETRLDSNPNLVNINPNRTDQSATKYRSKYNVTKEDLDEL